MLGLDDIEEILGELEDEDEIVDVEKMEEEAEAVKAGETTADIKDPDEIMEEDVGQDFNPNESDFES
jgi:hypothetical protein